MAIGDVFKDTQKAYDANAKAQLRLQELRNKAADAIAAKTAELDAVKAEHAAYVEAAQADADQAKAELVRFQEQLHDFLGRPDPRVTVK
jgi:FtsZ-binding cell division protein ZapB